MLAEAGVSDLKMKIWAMPVARPYNPNARRLAEVVQADFAAVGLEVEIVSCEWESISSSPVQRIVTNEAKQKSDQAERTALYQEARVVFQREAPWGTISHSVVFMPMSMKVMNYKMDPLGSHRFDGVDIVE